MARQIPLNDIIRTLNKVKIPPPYSRYEQYRIAVPSDLYLNMAEIKPDKAMAIPTLNLVADYIEGSHNQLTWYLILE